jgi:uncharacterized membrane protein YphA (DoxX/SURF4 family)
MSPGSSTVVFCVADVTSLGAVTVVMGRVTRWVAVTVTGLMIAAAYPS